MSEKSAKAPGGVSDQRELWAAIEGLQRLAEVFDRRRQQLAHEVGLSDGQWRLLEEVATEHFMPSLFARRRRCTPAAVSRTLKQLLAADMIGVSISSKDARQRDYALTDRGRRALEHVQSSRERALDAVWRDLPRAELERFGSFSAALADRLELYAEQVESTPE